MCHALWILCITIIIYYFLLVLFVFSLYLHVHVEYILLGKAIGVNPGGWGSPPQNLD